MREETRIQIENLKNQTFGVEIKGNNITRERAAQKAAAFFGTGRWRELMSNRTVNIWYVFRTALFPID